MADTSQRLTSLEPEEKAYTKRGAQVRIGRAFFPDGKIRRVWAGIPDTYFTIPAHGKMGKRYVKGFLVYGSERSGEIEGELYFRIHEKEPAAKGEV